MKQGCGLSKHGTVPVHSIATGLHEMQGMGRGEEVGCAPSDNPELARQECPIPKAPHSTPISIDTFTSDMSTCR